MCSKKLISGQEEEEAAAEASAVAWLSCRLGAEDRSVSVLVSNETDEFGGKEIFIAFRSFARSVALPSLSFSFITEL